MIGKGAQYLTAAGFGRYRITAASLGSLDILGTWRWLTTATTQAIMAAFGVDGTAVIAATNEYLNGIAASDKAKATALAGFINEDPMMVCSLGLEPTLTTLPKMPWRVLIGTGGAYINTGWIPTSQCIMEAKMANNSTNQWSSFGSRKAYLDHSFVLQENPSEYILFDVETTRLTTSIKPTKDIPTTYKIDAQNRKGYINQNVYDLVAFNGNTYPIYFFAINNNGGLINENPSTYCYGKIWDNGGEEKREMYPWTENGVNGMIDVIEGIFHPKQGNGTMSISYGYMQNGSWVTWTPPTP